MKLGEYLLPWTKLRSKWIKDLNLKHKTQNLLDREIDSNLHNIGVENNFLKKDSIYYGKQTDNWNLMKQKLFCWAKETVKLREQNFGFWLYLRKSDLSKLTGQYLAPVSR